MDVARAAAGRKGEEVDVRSCFEIDESCGMDIFEVEV